MSREKKIRADLSIYDTVWLADYFEVNRSTAYRWKLSGEIPMSRAQKLVDFLLTGGA